jgi:predicted anti-sigma-YlaC factor YlaD
MASGFAQYSYAFVNQDADRLEDKNLQQGREVAARARRHYLRARDYALDGIELAHAGTKAALLGGDREAWKRALATMKADDVPYLYWCGASWGLAVSTAKDDPKLVGDLGIIGLLMTRTLELDESYDEGALHEFFVSFDAARGEMQGGGPLKSKEHLDRAQALSKGTKLGSLISYAEAVLVQKQQKAEFVALLKKVLDTNVHVDDPMWRKNRLANLIAQSRARWLMSKLDDLFAE